MYSKTFIKRKQEVMINYQKNDIQELLAVIRKETVNQLILLIRFKGLLMHDGKNKP